MLQYNNRLYPHPVIGIADDVDGTFEVELKVSSNSKFIAISPTFKVTNADLKSHIMEGTVLFTSHIYCRGTMYREVFKTQKNIPDAIKIPSNRLNGEVEVDFFLCADKNIGNYCNKGFSNDYRGFTFAIDKGDILGYGGKGKFYANKSPEELKSISALMKINSTGKNSHAMFNDYDGDKITIMLCQEDYENYQTVRKGKDSFWSNLLLSSIVLPALTEAIHFLKDDMARDFSKNRWYTILTELVKNSKENNKLKIAQNILDLPNNRLFGTLNQLMG